MTIILPSHVVTNMWFGSQFKEQRNLFEVPSWRSPAATTFMILLLLCIFVPPIVRYWNRTLSKAAFPLAGRTQEAFEPYREHQTPSSSSVPLLTPTTSTPVIPVALSEAPPLPLQSAPSAPPPHPQPVVAVEEHSSTSKRPEKPIKYRYTPENPHHMCGHTCLPPTVTGPAPAKCTHPNHIRQAPHGDEFELVSIEDGLGRFDTVPMMGVLEQWEQDRIIAPDSIVSCHTNSVLSTLAVQSSCYSYEQVLYCNVIACMLEIFETHGPKMLRNKKKIGGSYYYHLCEMLREPDNQAAAATFMMMVSLGKRAEMLATKNPWGPECMKPSLLSLLNLFHDLLAISDEELDETIESWARTAKEWSLAMIYLKMAHKRLWQESPLYLTGSDIYESKDDSEKAQSYVQQCLRAGDDKGALANQDLARLRQEVLLIHRQMDNKLNNCRALKKMTPYDIDLLKFYTATLGQLCTTGNMVNALVAWRDQRREGMRKLRALAIERKCRDLTMQELAGGAESSGSEQEQSDSELSSTSSGPSISSASTASSAPVVEDLAIGLEPLIAEPTITVVSPAFVPVDISESSKIWQSGAFI
ncbi:hypothetical protein TWF281_000022 [Arthrobotrys megalospora]